MAEKLKSSGLGLGLFDSEYDTAPELGGHADVSPNGEAQAFLGRLSLTERELFIQLSENRLPIGELGGWGIDLVRTAQDQPAEVCEAVRANIDQVLLDAASILGACSVSETYPVLKYFHRYGNTYAQWHAAPVYQSAAASLNDEIVALGIAMAANNNPSESGQLLMVAEQSRFETAA